MGDQPSAGFRINDSNDPLFREFVKAKENGQTADEIVRLMRRRGMIIVHAIAAFKLLYNVSLGEAKKSVAGNPIWRDIAEPSERMQDELIEALKQPPDQQALRSD